MHACSIIIKIVLASTMHNYNCIEDIIIIVYIHNIF